MEDFDITDEEVDELLEKHVTQLDSIDEGVNEHLESMGFLWITTQEKLQSDGICYSCKRTIDFETENAHVRQAKNTDKGVVAFVLLCDECLKKLEEQEEVVE